LYYPSRHYRVNDPEMILRFLYISSLAFDTLPAEIEDGQTTEQMLNG